MGQITSEQNGPHTAVQIPVRSSDEFRLICDPFFNRLPGNQGRVAADRSYDLVYLGKRTQGTWAFRLLLHRSSDDDDDDDNNNNMQPELHLEQFYQRRRDIPLRRQNTLHLPLYFDGNSSCIHVGDRNRDISELGLDLPPQPTIWSEEVEGDDDDDEDDDKIQRTGIR
jgi:hypothetical protein